MTEFGKYEAMKAAGAEPVDVYGAARADGLDLIASTRMLRLVYKLTVPEAKSIIFLSETGETIDEHYAKHADDYIRAIDEALKDL